MVAGIREITLAIELIELGGASLLNGMLPYSTDWFMTWQPNIHSSLFHAIYRFIDEHRDAAGCIAEQAMIQVIVKSYRLYLEHMALTATSRCCRSRAHGRWCATSIRGCCRPIPARAAAGVSSRTPTFGRVTCAACASRRCGPARPKSRSPPTARQIAA